MTGQVRIFVNSDRVCSYDRVLHFSLRAPWGLIVSEKEWEMTEGMTEGMTETKRFELL